MKIDKTLEIVNLCLKIDKIAYKLYQEFSSQSKKEDLQEFWYWMAQEELNHINFWNRAQKLAKEWTLPKVFDNPEDIVKEFKTIIPKVKSIYNQNNKNISIYNTFLIACRLEFYLLHSALTV